MAVPSSGAIKMLNIRNEIASNNYNNNVSFNNVSLQSMSVGGEGKTMIPVEKFNAQCMSMGFLVLYLN